MFKSQLLLPLLCGTVLVCQAGAVHAQAQLEEITVTARKREESLMSVPVAVTAVSAQALRNGLASDLTKMAELAPQVNIGQGGAGTGAVITVRGVSSSSSDAGIDQSVAIEIDGVPLSRGQVVTTSLFDIGNVQVLQGPQALFFGKNSPAGVISIRSADPTDKPEGYVTAGYEFKADQKFVEAAASGPITDTLKGRIALRGSKMEGWMKNVAVPLPFPLDPMVTTPGASSRRNSEEVWAARIGLLWSPTDDFDAKLKLELNTQKRDSGGPNLEPFCIPPTTTPVLLGVIPLPTADCKRDMVKSVSDVPSKYAANFPNANNGVPYADSRYIIGSLNLNKRFEGVTLTSTTGYFYQKYKNLNISDTSPYATIWSASNEAYRLFTEEVRANSDFAGPVNGAAGVYYEHFSRPYFNSPDLFNAFNPTSQNYAYVELDSHSSGNYFSVFGQLRWNIMPDLELAGGARYSHDQKKITMVNVSTAAGAATASLRTAGVPLLSSYSNNNVSPEATLSWHPHPEQTLYVAFKTGYKAGGMSNPFLVTKAFTADTIKFKPEKTIGFEGGYKATLMDRRLRMDVTGYRYTYKDLQVVAYDVTSISFFLRNAARARVQGVQGSAEWLVVDDLTFRGNFGFNDAKYLSFPGATCYAGQTVAQGCNATGQDLAGKHLVRAPKLTFSLGADYKAHLGDWAATFSVSGSHSGSYNADTNISPGGFQDAYWLLNASVRVGPEDGKYELAFIGRNLTNSYYMLQTYGWSGSSNPNQYFAYHNRPREVVLQATARF